MNTQPSGLRAAELATQHGFSLVLQHRLTEMLGPWQHVATVHLPRVNWDMDDHAWLVLDEQGSCHWVTTDHGRLTKTTRDKIASDLSALRRTLEQSEAALHAATERGDAVLGLD